MRRSFGVPAQAQRSGLHGEEEMQRRERAFATGGSEGSGACIDDVPPQPQQKVEGSLEQKRKQTAFGVLRCSFGVPAQARQSGGRPCPGKGRALALRSVFCTQQPPHRIFCAGACFIPARYIPGKIPPQSPHCPHGRCARPDRPGARRRW